MSKANYEITLEKGTYSKEEQLVGAWINNKPVYQKTIELGYLPNNNSKFIKHEIENLDIVIGFESFGKRNTDNINFPLSSKIISVFINPNSIQIQTDDDRANVYAYITLKYTKTTD